MVFIDDRIAYLSVAIKNEKLNALHSLLWDRAFILPPGSHSEIDDFYFKLIAALINDNLQAFSEVYEKISKRTPSKESPQPFVNNDPLLFVLIAGVKRFSFNKNWILSVISVRQRNLVTITYENILNDNFFSKSNSYGIIISISRLLNSIELSNQYLSEGYTTIMAKLPTMDIKSDIEIMCSYCAIDEIVTTKEIPGNGHYSDLKGFEQRFLLRTRILGIVLSNIALLSLLLLTFLLLMKYPQFNSHLNTYGVWYSIIVTIIFNLLSKIRSRTIDIVRFWLGYKTL